MSALPKHRWTAEEYLAFDRQSPLKHEFYDGEIYDMVGGSARHGLIAMHVGSLLDVALRNSSCYVYSSDVKVRVIKSKMYSYPDVTVVCDKPTYEDDQKDVIVNPTIIVEVLSPSTQDYDRGDKSRAYRGIPSLQACLLIAQDKPYVEYYLRQSDQSWLIREAEGMQAIIDIIYPACTLPLGEIYRNVEFDEPDNS